MSTETSAPETKFCGDRIGTDDLYLWVDGNQKITIDGDFDNPKPNALSLVQVTDCPNRTKICEKSCYVHGLEKFAPETHALYKHNSKVLHHTLHYFPNAENALKLAFDLSNWINDNCTAFRWHVSGDVFSNEYAAWIVRVCSLTPDVNHWIYTRSLPFVPTLSAANNLTINISCDADNYAKVCLNDWRGVEGGIDRLRFCYLSHDGAVPVDLRQGSIIFPDYTFRKDKEWFKATKGGPGMICPVDYFGKTKSTRCGVCKRCL